MSSVSATLTSTRLVVASTANPSRSVRPPMRVCAVPRREAIGFLAGVIGGAVIGSDLKAEAIEIPFQESIAGREAVGQSEASMKAYDMEGIKKGGISKKEKRKILEELRSKAIALSAK